MIPSSSSSSASKDTSAVVSHTCFSGTGVGGTPGEPGSPRKPGSPVGDTVGDKEYSTGAEVGRSPVGVTVSVVDKTGDGVVATAGGGSGGEGEDVDFDGSITQKWISRRHYSRRCGERHLPETG